MGENSFNPMTSENFLNCASPQAFYLTTLISEQGVRVEGEAAFSGGSGHDKRDTQRAFVSKFVLERKLVELIKQRHELGDWYGERVE